MLAQQSGAVDQMALAEALTLKGYSITVKKSLGSVATMRCLQTLRHTYLTCACEGADPPTPASCVIASKVKVYCLVQCTNLFNPTSVQLMKIATVGPLNTQTQI